MNPQKQLIILIAIAAGLTSFLAGYVLTQSGGKVVPDNVLAQQRSAILDRFNGVTPSPTAAPIPDGVFQLETQAALSPAANPSNDSILYYQSDSGHVSSVDPTTRILTEISATDLPHLVDVIWSHDTRQVVTVYATKAGTTYKYYTYDTREQATLGSDIAAAAFSPDGSKLALAKIDGNGIDITVGQPGGTGQETILKTEFAHVSLTWPAEHSLSLIASTQNGQTLYQVSDQGDVTDLIDTTSALEASWSPDASQIIYSTASASGATLSLYTLADHSQQTLDLQASANQCAWTHDSASLVCAGTRDHGGVIARLDAATGIVSDLFSDLIVTPGKVLLTHNEDYAILTDQTDSSLYAFHLR